MAIEMQLPGYIRATVSKDSASTKVEWAHDSAWRFLPTIRRDVVGFVLHPIDLQELKARWPAALDAADTFVRSRPPGEAGCLYYSPGRACFVAPADNPGDAVPHYGRPGGVLPRVIENPP